MLPVHNLVHFLSVFIFPNACAYPRILACVAASQELNSSSSCPPSVLASTAMIFAGLLLVPCVSTPLSSYSGVTFSTLHMIRIFSAVGFVFFFFQSLTVVSGMPVLFANSFCVISSSLILAKMRSLIVIINTFLHHIFEAPYGSLS